MDLIQALKEKSELDRQRFEAELPVLAERVAHGEATEKEVAAWVKASGKSLDDLQAAVDRQLEIDRLQALTDLFRERSIAAYKQNLEFRKYQEFVRKSHRDLEAEETRLRVSGWHLGIQATESREAFAKLGQMTGVLHSVPNLAEDYRAIDAEFAIIADAVTVPVVAEVQLPGV